MDKLPCEDCIVLAVCLQRFRQTTFTFELKCSLLNKFLSECESNKNLMEFNQYMLNQSER